MSMEKMLSFGEIENRNAAFGNACHLASCTFEGDNALVPQLQQAKRYADHWEELRLKGTGLLLWGPPGNGKTYAAACIANALRRYDGREGSNVIMATLSSLFTRLLSASPQEKERLLKTLTDCELLILDDFGMERQTEYTAEQTFQIINGRYLARMPMVITTNLSLEELKHPRDLQQQRIYDRVLEMCVPVYFAGESLRPARAKDNLRRFREITGQ